jgi:hypothetical protein
MFGGMKALLPLCAIALLCSACAKDVFVKVRYQVNCGSRDLTYENNQGGTEQHSMSGSWNLEMDMNHGQFMYISAQNNNASGTVGVSILCDGDVFKTSSSSGAYVIATASGSAP